MIRSALAGAALASLTVTGAFAQDITLRIQTHLSPESMSGKQAAQFFDDLSVMSGGRIAIEPFYSSAVVKSVETFDAAVNGILDGDMTGGAYQTGASNDYDATSLCHSTNCLTNPSIACRRPLPPHRRSMRPHTILATSTNRHLLARRRRCFRFRRRRRSRPDPLCKLYIPDHCLPNPVMCKK